MTAKIRNCEFRFKCPRAWESLAETFDPRVRQCDQCNRRVYCRTSTELRKAIFADECVAVEVGSPGEEIRMLVGEPLVDQIFSPKYSK
jgi:hypothetical protein